MEPRLRWRWVVAAGGCARGAGSGMGGWARAVAQSPLLPSSPNLQLLLLLPSHYDLLPVPSLPRRVHPGRLPLLRPARRNRHGHPRGKLAPLGGWRAVLLACWEPLGACTCAAGFTCKLQRSTGRIGRVTVAAPRPALLCLRRAPSVLDTPACTCPCSLCPPLTIFCSLRRCGAWTEPSTA